ncbi:MAG: FAD binding domain-containing protein [Candidatus Kapaibacterium sp.]
MKVQLKFICNKEIISGDFNPAMTVLDFLRNMKELKGTKEGCREGDCGACTVLVGELTGNFVHYKNVNSCLLPLGDIDGKHLVTVEGLNTEGMNLFQQFLVNNGGTQCGFCTPGFVMSFASYLLSADTFDEAGAKDYLTGNLCRCTGHKGIQSSAEDVISILNKKEINSDRIKFLSENKLLPEYFNVVASKLKQITRVKHVHSFDEAKKLVSGGTDIYVQKGDVISNFDVVLMSELLHEEKIKIIDNECIISAAATVADLETSAIFSSMFPEFKNVAKLFGSRQIRNKATLGGNINNASPIGDMTVFFLSLNSKITLLGKGVAREIFLKDYFKGYKTLDKNADEIMTKLTFTIPGSNFKNSFEKVSKRKYLDIASVNTSFSCNFTLNKFSGVNISAGGVAPVPLYLAKTSQFLDGKEINIENINNVIETALEEISPISDVRGSADYKRLLLRNLMYAHFMKLFPEVISEEVMI